MFYVYIIRSEIDHNLYVGFTTDLRKRIKDHNEGCNTSTRCRRPLRLMYYEAYLSEKDARTREIFLKSGRGREIMKKQLADTFIGDCSSIG